MNFFPIGVLTFAHPWWLLLLLLLPALAIANGARGAAPAVVFSSLQAIKPLGKPRRSRMGAWLTSLLLLALALLIAALARPQAGSTVSHTEASGIDIMLALDVSGSMIAEDFTIGGQRASRIEVVKNVTQSFIDGRPNDRIGMLCFASRPYLVSPLTLDHDWLLRNMERVRLGLVEDGTAIGSAIASCANRLKERKDAKSRIVVLLTDGDNNAGKISPLTAAEAAAALGIKVYTIGAGTNGEAPMPMQDPFGRKIYQNVKVDVDEDTLKKIADITGGRFYRATDTKTLKQIFEQIDTLEKSKMELTQYKQYRDLFPWFLGAGLVILAFQGALAQTKGRRLP
jgi:Ca-activated chloride channel family protein